MSGIQRTLLAILAFVTIAVGSFIYFIANWDASKAEPIGSTYVIQMRSAALSLPNNTWAQGRHSRLARTISGATT